ncbi:hypothetical protein MMC25_000041 [Agyrium rufum]|nr:hypothetical protein [Agyrium rufum]
MFSTVKQLVGQFWPSGATAVGPKTTAKPDLLKKKKKGITSSSLPSFSQVAVTNEMLVFLQVSFDFSKNTVIEFKRYRKSKRDYWGRDKKQAGKVRWQEEDLVKIHEYEPYLEPQGREQYSFPRTRWFETLSCKARFARWTSRWVPSWFQAHTKYPVHCSRHERCTKHTGDEWHEQRTWSEGPFGLLLGIHNYLAFGGDHRHVRTT